MWSKSDFMAYFYFLAIAPNNCTYFSFTRLKERKYVHQIKLDELN